MQKIQIPSSQRDLSSVVLDYPSFLLALKFCIEKLEMCPCSRAATLHKKSRARMIILAAKFGFIRPQHIIRCFHAEGQETAAGMRLDLIGMQYDDQDTFPAFKSVGINRENEQGKPWEPERPAVADPGGLLYFCRHMATVCSSPYVD